MIYGLIRYCVNMFKIKRMNSVVIKDKFCVTGHVTNGFTDFTFNLY